MTKRLTESDLCEIRDRFVGADGLFPLWLYEDMDKLLAEIRALQQDVAKVMDACERALTQAEIRQRQIEKLERDKAALVDFVDAMTKDPPDVWRKKYARKVLEEVK